MAVVCDDEAAFLERVEELDRVTFDDRPAGILERREYLAPGIRIYVETNELEIYRYGEDGEVVSTPNFLANAWDFGWGGSGIYGYVDGPFYFVPTAPVRAFGAYAWTADGGLEYWAYDGAPPNMPPGDRILAGAISVPRSSEEVPYLGLILRCDVGSFVIMEPDAPSLCCGVGIDDVLLACPAP